MVTHTFSPSTQGCRHVSTYGDPRQPGLCLCRVLSFMENSISTKQNIKTLSKGKSVFVVLFCFQMFYQSNGKQTKCHMAEGTLIL